MAGYLTTAQVSSYQNAFSQLHETFGRDVVVWKTANRVVIQEEPSSSSYNFLYPEDSQEGVTETFTPVSGVYKMRIKWGDASKKLDNDNAQLNDLRPTIKENLCRLKMTPEAFEFIKGYKEFYVDGRPCEWVGYGSPHGIVGNQFVSIIVREVN